MPSPIALIEALATGLWTYTALTLLAWINLTRRLPRGAHVAAVVDLLGHLVPAMIALVAVVLIGALAGLPSVVALIALLFPAGTAYGTHMALGDATEASASALPRIAATLVIAAGVIAWRHLP